MLWNVANNLKSSGEHDRKMKKRRGKQQVVVLSRYKVAEAMVYDGMDGRWSFKTIQKWTKYSNRGISDSFIHETSQNLAI